MRFSSSLTITTSFLSFLPAILGAPIPDPQGFLIGKPCYGSAATGCTLKQGHRRAIDIVAREPEPIPDPAPEPVFVIGTPCFGSTATGCTLKQGHKRDQEDLTVRDPEPIAEPEPEIIARDPEAAPEPGFVIGTPCFGSTATGCTLKQGHKRDEEDLTIREPEPIAEPEPKIAAREPGFVIGTPCFGSTATGCTLKQGHKREEEIISREPEPVAEAVPAPIAA